MDGRRIYHARGKVLGGSSSINGMIFQRGNPLDYERWAADPGMEDWDYAHCLPYFKRMETCLAAAPDDAFRGHDGPLVLERGRPTNPLFGAFFEAVAAGRLPAHRRRQRLPAGGLRAVRPQRPPRAAAVRGPRLPAPGDAAAEPRRCGPGRSSPGSLFEGTRAVGVEYRRGGGRLRRVARRRGHPVRRRHQLAAAAAAVRRRQRRRAAALGIDVVARPARRRREPPGPPRGLRPVRLHAAGLDAAVPASGGTGRGSASAVAVPARAARARPTTSRAAASSAATTRSPTRT